MPEAKKSPVRKTVRRKKNAVPTQEAVAERAYFIALEQMHREAREAEERTTELAGNLDGKKTAILEKARETKQEATEMMSTYLGDDADALDGFEFLTMAEAGEVGHWGVVAEMAKKAKQPDLQKLAMWAQPIQQRHFDATLKGSLALARSQDPNEEE